MGIGPVSTFWLPCVMLRLTSAQCACERPHVFTRDGQTPSRAIAGSYSNSALPDWFPEWPHRAAFPAAGGSTLPTTAVTVRVPPRAAPGYTRRPPLRGNDSQRTGRCVQGRVYFNHRWDPHSEGSGSRAHGAHSPRSSLPAASNAALPCPLPAVGEE